MNIRETFAVAPGTRYYGLNQDAYMHIKFEVKDHPDDLPPLKEKKSKGTSTPKKVKTSGAGSSPPNPSPVTKEPIVSTLHAWGIFDGHFMLGEVAARTAAASFEKRITQRITSAKIDDKTLSSLYRSVHQDILAIYDNLPKECSYPSPVAKKLTKFQLSTAGPRPTYSLNGKMERPIEFGTTALLIILNERTKELIVTWAGDSRAILVSHDEDSEELSTLSVLSDCHNGRNPKERKRVESGYPAQITPDGYLKPKDKYFSGFEVAMTRALGHKVLGAFGLTFEPQVRRLKLSKRDAVLVIASDGLWEKLTDREVVNICRETEDKTKVAESLLKAVRI